MGRVIVEDASDAKTQDTEVTDAFLEREETSRLPVPESGRKWRLGLKSAAAFAGYMAMCAALSLLGPTLVSMAILHETDTTGISWAFTSSRAGGLMGAALCGVIFERLDPELQLGAACYVLAVAMAMAPWTGRLLGFIAVYTFVGAGTGFIGTGSFPYLLKLWEGSRSRDTVMHVMAIFCTLGRFLTPLLIRDLVNIENDDTSGYHADCAAALSGTERDNFTKTSLTSFQTVNGIVTVNQSYDRAMYVNSEGNTDKNTTDPSGISLVNTIFNATSGMTEVRTSRYAYMVISTIPLIGALIYTVSSCVNKSYRSVCVRKKVVGAGDDTTTGQQRKEDKIPRMVLLGLYCLYMFISSFLETSLGGYLSVFIARGLCWDVKTGNDVLTVFWGLHGVGRLVTVVASRWLSTRVILSILLGFYAAGLIIGLFTTLLPQLIWVTAVLAGTGASGMYFTSLVWMSTRLQVTGRVSAILVTTMFFGGMVEPLVVSTMMERYGHMWLLYIQLGALVCECILVGVTEGIANKYNIKANEADKIEITVGATEKNSEVYTKRVVEKGEKE